MKDSDFLGIANYSFPKAQEERLSLRDLRESALPRVKATDLFEAKADVEETAWQDDLNRLDQYLSAFVSTEFNRCPSCQATLGGFLGSFRYSIAYGEGNCSCGWPCRANHKVDGIGSFEIILPYHPDEVHRRREPSVDA